MTTNLGLTNSVSVPSLNAKPAKTTQRKKKNFLQPSTTRLERSVSDLGTTSSDHTFGEFDIDRERADFHFAAFLDTHLPDGMGLKQYDAKNRSLSWQHMGSKSSIVKSKGTEKKTTAPKVPKGEGSNSLVSSSSGVLFSSSSTSPAPVGSPSDRLDALLNQPIKKKRTSKGAKFRMFTRVWVPAFNVAGCITQEKNGGWKYVQFDTGLPLPLPSALASTLPHSPKLLSKGLLDGKWCRACDMEEIHDGMGKPVQNLPNQNVGAGNISRNISNNLNRSDLLMGVVDDLESDTEFEENILGLTPLPDFNGNSLQFFSHLHSEHGSEDGYDSPSIPQPPVAVDQTILVDDLDAQFDLISKKRRDRSDSLDLMTLSEFTTIGMNTKLEDSLPSLKGVGSGIEDFGWHTSIEYGGITLDDCDWNL